MREILFKAKRVDNGEWIEGYYVEGAIDAYSFTVEHGIQQDGCYAVDILRGTLCQYTGINDKNGTKVFEGDEFMDSCECLCRIEFIDGSFCCDSVDNEVFDICEARQEIESAVITRNIHD